MQKKSTSESGLFTPRVLVALALCSFGVLLGMFSLAATPPVETTRANTSLPADPRNFLSTVGSNANRLPPGVPLPPSGLDAPPGRKPGTQFSVNGQGGPSSSSPTAGFPGVGGMPLRPGTASGANSLGNPVFANQQPAPPSVLQPAASGSIPLAPAAQSGWSIVTSPNALVPKDALSGVTCVSASDCWAVGYSFSGSVTQTLVERWDGTSWAIVTSPNTSATQNNFLSGVTCVSASDCWAVGGSSNGSADQTLVERWDGTSWAIVTSPNPLAPPGFQTLGTALIGVTCVSGSDCWAAGYYEEIIINPPSGQSQTLIEHWNGTSWAIVTSANTSPTQNNNLFGVACASASDCWAVGAFFNGAEQALIERWDGTAWTIVTSAIPLASQGSILNGVTCVSASDCWAVGTSSDPISGQVTLTERWDGTAWTVVTSANPSATQNNVNLQRVTCVSASDCWAVGYSLSSSAVMGGVVFQTLIEQWNGTAWAIVTSANTSGTQNNSLVGVACVSASECWAVGNASNGSADQTLIERWDGTSWAIVTSPNTLSPTPSILLAVTCVSASDCWAVGYSFNGANYQTLVERWDGTAWAIVTSANASPTQNNVLYGVTCVSASNCWAVGYAVSFNQAGYIYQTLIERWDGTSWAIVTSPNPLGLGPSILYGVTCLTASDCWAVGYSSNGMHLQTLVERWNGTAWAIVTSANTLPTQDNVLNGVTCVSASNCWAVGSAFGSVYQTLVERWDGTSWAVITSPNTSTTQNDVLYGVTCVSASDCWAVGYYHNGSNYQTLTEQWNGSSWTIVTSDNTSATQDNVLLGVTCMAASNCWAVGESYNGTAVRTLTEHWDGTSWAVVTSPNTSATQNNVLNGVACVSASECWAVGVYRNGRTLIEEYTLTIPPLTGVVSELTHGSAGTFDIDLPLTGTRGVECRSSASLGAGNYTVIFSFVNNVTNCGTAGTVGASVSSGPNSNQCTENLTGVTNAQYITVTLNNVLDAQNNTGTVSTTMGVLIGDVNADGGASNLDVSLVKAKVAAGATVDSSNFRDDVNADGGFSNLDVSITKAQVAAGAQLPSPP